MKMAAGAAMATIEVLKFGERDLSNAAKIPEVMASVMGTVNKLVSFATAMADVKFKGDEVHNRCTALENDVAFLRARALELSTKLALEEVRQQAKIRAERDEERFQALEHRAALFEALNEKALGHDAWIAAASLRLDRHQGDIEAGGVAGARRDARLEGCEGSIAAHSHTIKELTTQNNARVEEAVAVRAALAAGLAQRDLGLSEVTAGLDETRGALDRAVREAVDQHARWTKGVKEERAQTKEDVHGARASASARSAEVVAEQARVNQELSGGTAKAEQQLTLRAERDSMQATERMGRYRQSPLGPVDPSFRALSGRLKFTVRRHKFNKDSLSMGRLANDGERQGKRLTKMVEAAQAKADQVRTSVSFL